MTSMGVQLDKILRRTGQRVYTFQASGLISHYIGCFLPATNNRLCFLQLYIYNTNNKSQNKLVENDQLHASII